MNTVHEVECVITSLF